MRAWCAVAAAFVLVAGCSDGPKAADTQSTEPAIDYGVEATSTTGVIRGYVVDEAIRPIANVAVTIVSLDKTKTTGDEGAFAFDGLEPGTYFLQASKLGYQGVQTSVEVVAGESEPPVTKINLASIPSQQPFVEAFHYTGYLTFGAAVFATSIGTTIYGPVAEQFNDQSIWVLKFTQLPLWAQGELVWDQTQPLGGQFIWEMTDTSNTHYGYRETTNSPALAYWDTETLVEHNKTTLDPERGIAYRFFGGPHELCKDPLDATFGCGLTVQQQAEVYIHNFYNFAPPEGWRYTVDGEPVPPT